MRPFNSVLFLLAIVAAIFLNNFAAPAKCAAQTVVSNPTYVCPSGEDCTVRPEWSESGFNVSGNSAQTIRLELPSNPEAEQATGNDNFGINLGVALGGGFVNSDGPTHGSGALVVGGHYALGKKWYLVGDVGIGVASLEGVRVMHSEFIGFGYDVSSHFRLNLGARHRIIYETTHDAMNAVLGELQADFRVGERFHIVPALAVGAAWFPGSNARSSEDQYLPAPTTGGNTGTDNNTDTATEGGVTSGLVVTAGVTFSYSF